MATFLRKWNICTLSAKLAWNSSAVTTQKPARPRQMQRAAHLDGDGDRQQVADHAGMEHEHRRLVVAARLADTRPQEEAGHQAARDQENAAVARFVHRPSSPLEVLSV